MIELFSKTEELPFDLGKADVKELLTTVSPICWNSSFNEAAEFCGLSADDLLAMPDTYDKAIGQVFWSRRGSKIHVAIGQGFWTVDVKDVAGGSHG